MTASSARAKYLSRYATPEAVIAHELVGPWCHALVVPACGETADLLTGYVRAARAAQGRVLVILIVNASEDATARNHQRNARTLQALSELYPGARHLKDDAARLHRGDAFDVLWLDRASESRRLPAKQGVGMARRMGCDIALSLVHRETLSGRWLHTSDADVVLPADYFTRTVDHNATKTSALVHPFRHTRGELSDAHAHAQALYEVSLRYYVAGLGHARSPYAYHAIGSTISISADAYAAARGMPMRQAGEDFYLLNKLAKLGRIDQLGGDPIHIVGRASDRVPFGTGRATMRIAAARSRGDDFTMYHPTSFALLRIWLEALDLFASKREWARVSAYMDEHAGEQARVLGAAIARIGAPSAIRDAAQRCRGERALRRRVHEWMDAFRTLKLIHALRDRGLEMLPWRDALASEPFSLAAHASPEQVCDSLARMAPSDAGVA